MAQFEISNPTIGRYQFILRGTNRDILLHGTDCPSLKACLEDIENVKMNHHDQEEISQAEIVNYSVQ